jgi:hypothetical protein
MRRGRPVVLLVLSLLTTASEARPEQPPQGPPAVAPRAKAPAAPKPSVPPPEPKPAPNVRLTVHSPTGRGPWTMRVTNDGDIPVRIVADARLLSLDVAPRSTRSPVRCELPADMRSSSDLERALVVPAKRSYTETFEPRLYCFGKLDALVPGAIVVAHLGWTSGPKAKPPFEASPIEGIEPAILALKSIDSPPIALPDEPSAWPPAGSAQKQDDIDADSPRLSLRGPTFVDAMSPNEIDIALTLRNDSQRAAIVRFRPEVLGFDVIGSGRIEQCAWPTMPAAALREMFTTLAPKGAETLDVSLGDYCTDHALDLAGLLVVRPRLDTRKAPGAVLGLPSFEGAVVAMTPTVVRLHRGAALPGPLQSPQLEPQ